MALLWIESFDSFVTADLAEKYAFSSSAAPAITAGAGRRSTAAIRLWYATWIKKLLAPSGTTVIVGFSVRLEGMPASSLGGLAGVQHGSVNQVSLTADTDGTLQVWAGNPGDTLLGSGGMITNGVPYFIEMKVVLGTGTSGSVIVRINETEVINVTGVNTAPSGTAIWSQTWLGGVTNPSAGGYTYIDDWHVLDGSGAAPLNDFLGDCRVDKRIPTADGAVADWTPLSGTRASNVDDAAPDDDTTYNSTLTAGATDTFVVEDAPVVGATVYGVQLNVGWKKADAGGCVVAPIIRSGGTNYPGPTVNPGTTYFYTSWPVGLNPATSAPWTEAAYNAAEFGYRRIS